MCWSHRTILRLHSEIVIGTNTATDYMHRPTKYESVCLYDWIRRAQKNKMSKSRIDAEEKEGEFLVDEIVDHKWIKKRIKFLVRWNLGDES